MFYSVPEQSDSRFEIEGNFDLKDRYEAELQAESCADDYHDEHDGWECDWPLDFCLFETEDSPCLWRFNVTRDYDTVFSARLTPEKK